MLSGVPERSSGATAGGATQTAQRERDIQWILIPYMTAAH